MKRLPAYVSFSAVLLSMFCCGPSVHAEGKESAAKLTSGIDQNAMDTSVRPQDDFYHYVNGGWIKNTEIPADKSRWGSFFILREESAVHQRAIIEELATRQHLVAGSEEQKIADLYAGLMNESLTNSLGAKPVQAQLKLVDDVTSVEELLQAFAKLQRMGIAGPLVTYISIDSGNSTEYAVYVTQAGLSLPNRNYYLEKGEKFEEIRKRYPEHIAKLYTLAGISNADERAQSVYDLEMKIAEIQWTPEDNRDVSKTNNRVAVAELAGVSKQIDWPGYLGAMGVAGRVNTLFVRQPTYIEQLGGLLHDVPLEHWKNYLRFRILNDASSWLSDDFVDADFAFFGKLINGLEEMEPRWQRSVSVVDSLLGEAVGKVYVGRHFSPVAKERMDELVDNLLESFRTSLNELDWMSDETKGRAQEKRKKFAVKIGYPDEWLDYTALEIRRDDPLGNMHRAQEWDYNRQLARLGEPVDRAEWHMTPQTVNAYHNPRMNEIVFPAAILQPPFFNPNADDAVNYGGIGAVIGHETGHAFDDQGRKTDGDGNLNDWWTDADATAFRERAQALVEQYNSFKPLPDLHVNGQLTLGENIGDLTGLYIAYKAYRASLNGKEAPVIDGLTGDQRFFIGYAQIWRSKYREEAIRKQVLTDPHSPAVFRANGPLRNFGPFYEAFNVKPGDKMYLPPEERIQIW
ncbi:MAG: M13-type metalloendopeptidase [Planctomycetaceae bacterium]